LGTSDCDIVNNRFATVTAGTASDKNGLSLHQFTASARQLARSDCDDDEIDGRRDTPLILRWFMRSPVDEAFTTLPSRPRPAPRG
jgi:hypothetical protein